MAKKSKFNGNSKINPKLIALLAGTLIFGIFLINILENGFNFPLKKSNENIQEQETVQIAQNDFAGAYSRVVQLQNDVINSLDILQNSNYEIQQGNPDDYWSNDKYYFLSFYPVYEKELQYISMLNEINDFADIQNYITEQLENAGQKNISIYKEDTNHYFVSYRTYKESRGLKDTNYRYEYIDVFYDASHNGFRVVATVDATSSSNAKQLPLWFYEFSEIKKNTYALQNDTERLYVEYNDDHEIQYFAYINLLTGENAVYTKNNDSNTEQNENYDLNNDIIEQIISNHDETEQNTEIQTIETELEEETEIDIYQRGFLNYETDSIFLNSKSIDRNWVYDIANTWDYSSYIVYDSKSLNVTTTNMLSKEKESIIITSSK